MSTTEQISKLRSLQNGWLTDSSVAPSEAALDAAADILLDAAVVPCMDGSVQIEWHRDGLDIEITIDVAGKLTGISWNEAAVRAKLGEGI